MALKPSNSGILEQLALKGLMRNWKKTKTNKEIYGKVENSATVLKSRLKSTLFLTTYGSLQ